MESKKTGRRLDLILPIAVSALALVIFVGSVMEFNFRRVERANYEREIALLEEKVERLEHDLDAVMDDAYIESVAKDKLGLVNPDETIIYSDIGD